MGVNWGTLPLQLVAKFVAEDDVHPGGPRSRCACCLSHNYTIPAARLDVVREDDEESAMTSVRQHRSSTATPLDSTQRNITNRDAIPLSIICITSEAERLLSVGTCTCAGPYHYLLFSVGHGNVSVFLMQKHTWKACCWDGCRCGG